MYKRNTTWQHDGILSIPSNHAGGQEEFVFVGRLDNLAMSYCALQGLIDAFPDEASLKGQDSVKAVALFDHEEVGSSSAQGTLPLQNLNA